MFIALLFLVFSISVATADVIANVIIGKSPREADSTVRNLTSTQHVNCGGLLCKNGAVCKDEYSCLCPYGTKGDECEIISGCATLKDFCDFLNLECTYNPYKLSATCKCKDEKKIFDGGSCVDCNCGEFVASCALTFEGKLCFCKKGYAENSGICSPCYCGEFEDSCYFSKSFFQEEMSKTCSCKDGYAENAGICTRCTCGPHMATCTFSKGEKFCECDKGYEFKLGTCQGCDCGANSTNCRFNEADKICTCIAGNADKLGTCTHCDCGPDATCKFTSSGEKECECIGENCWNPGILWIKNNFVIFCIILYAGVFIGLASYLAYRKLRRKR